MKRKENSKEREVEKSSKEQRESPRIRKKAQVTLVGIKRGKATDELEEIEGRPLKQACEEQLHVDVQNSIRSAVAAK